MIRTLIGTLLGVVLGVGCLVIIAVLLRVDSLWPVVLLGVICGLCMRALTTGEGSCYVKSALAALAVLVATIGGKLAVAAILQNDEPAQNVASIIAADRAASVTAEPNTDRLASGAVRTPSDARGEGRRPAGLLGPPRHSDYSFLDGIWLSVGALIAYQLAKGRQGGRPCTSSAATSHVDPEQDRDQREADSPAEHGDR